MNRIAALIATAGLAFVMGFPSLAPLTEEAIAAPSTASEAREALAVARAQQRNARQRAERLARQETTAREASSSAITDAAMLAARVQQAEAGLAAAQARLALVERQRRTLQRDFARRQQPLARLTGALETMSRRPLVLAALRPGSLRDIVHTRAVLGSALPVVRERTTALRGDLARAKGLAAQHREIVQEKRQGEGRLRARQQNVLAMAEEQRIRAEQASAGSMREARRAAGLAQEAFTLDALVVRLAQGERMDTAVKGTVQARSDRTYALPVTGRVISRFGEKTDAGGRTSGIAIEARPEALVVAPASGRVAFAGAYEGYETIVIIAHPDGATSLVTGMNGASVGTGQTVVQGSPIGRAPAAPSRIGLELRRGGRPVDPLGRTD